MEGMESTQQGGVRAPLVSKSAVMKAKASLGITRLWKTYLAGLEDFTAEHDKAMAKLRDALPAEYKGYVNLADYLSDDKLARVRNGVLRVGNDLIRDLGETVDNLRID